MKRMVLTAAVAVAALGAAAVPAITGVIGNPSFSQQIPVPIPRHARVAHLDQPASAATPSPSPSPEPRGRGQGPSGRVEPGDDRGGDRSSGDSGGGRGHGGPGSGDQEHGGRG